MQARLLTTAPEKAEADALILPIFEGQSKLPPEAVALDKRLKGAITQLLADREFRGKFMELVPVHNLNTLPSKWTVLVGVGKPDDLDMVRLRNALQAAGRVLRKRGHRRVTVILPKDVAARASASDAARAVTEGIGLKMAALLAVARGSDEPAKMIVLRYTGGRKGGPVLALVGKGITFDSGGISIKPAQNMEMMKSDMGGGAAVVGAMLAIAALEPKTNVIGIVPTTENMPSGKAIKPGDVVTGAGGERTG